MVDMKASNEKLWDRGTRIIEHLTDLNYKKSFELLHSANGEVKTAIVMWKFNINCKTAKTKLMDVNGSLRKAIDTL